MRRRRHGGVRSARGYLESPKRPGRARVGFGLINARIPGGQRSSACISSRITTVIRVTVGATKGTITDLMSHSQFHCHARVYLDMHGLIFETSICYWQDQPGSRRSCAEDRSRRRSGAGDSTSRASAGAGSGSPPPPRGGAGGGERGARGGRAREREGLRRPSPPGPSEVSLGGSGLEAALEKKSHPRRGGRTPVVEPRPWEAGAPGDARAAPWRRTAATRNLGRRGADGTPRPEHGGGRARTRREEDPHPGLRFDGSPRRGGVRSA